MADDAEKRIFAFNDLCSGCRACALMCNFVQERSFGLEDSKIKIIKFENDGISIPILGCSVEDCTEKRPSGNPPCVEVCPTGALIYETPAEAEKKFKKILKERKTKPIYKTIAPWKLDVPMADLESKKGGVKDE
ncbi:MAG: hypothetical protein ACLFT6_07390 [Bacteroidales bacterium]